MNIYDAGKYLFILLLFVMSIFIFVLLFTLVEPDYGWVLKEVEYVILVIIGAACVVFGAILYKDNTP